jgi:uncharacterized protein (TIGR03083 family)
MLRPDPAALADRLEAAADRFVDALVAAPDASAGAGTLEWTVQQLAAHLATGAPAYTAMLRDEPSHLTDLRQREAAGIAAIAAEAGTPVGELADRIRASVKEFAELLRPLAADDPIRFYESHLPAAVVGSLFLNEFLVHGHDLGVAIPADDAALSAPPAFEVLATLVKPGKPERATLAFHVRGHGELVLEVDAGRAWVRAAGKPYDARLSAEPVTFLLTAYGRLTPLRPMLQRKLSVTGRRPWRLNALKTRFESP